MRGTKNAFSPDGGEPWKHWPDWDPTLLLSHTFIKPASPEASQDKTTEIFRMIDVVLQTPDQPAAQAELDPIQQTEHFARAVGFSAIEIEEPEGPDLN